MSRVRVPMAFVATLQTQYANLTIRQVVAQRAEAHGIPRELLEDVTPEGREALRDLLSALLVTHCDARNARHADLHDEIAIGWIDRLDLDWLAGLEVNPFEAFAMLKRLEMESFEALDARGEAAGVKVAWSMASRLRHEPPMRTRRLAIRIPLGPGITWQAGRLLIRDQRYPEMLLMSLEGEPLERLISSHATDGRGIRVRSVRAERRLVTIETDHSEERVPLFAGQRMMAA